MHSSRRPDARHPRSTSLLWCLLALGLATVPAGFARAATSETARTVDKTKFIGVDEIKPGQKATCRTVFEGRTIEEFELEVVGVVPGGKADGDMILARATGERLKHDGIAAGMSGSPIYIDGRLAGALAFSWSFTRDPLCGITPIAEMLDVMTQPDGPPTGDFGAGPIKLLPPPVPQQPRQGAGLEQLRTPLMAGGLTAEARAWLGPWAEENGFLLASGGVGGASRPRSAPRGTLTKEQREAARATLKPGAAISVDLMRGDMNLSAIGTMTYRDGDRIVAFGHPFFQSGSVSYPLALADITTIVASDLNSFKMGAPAEQVGAITQDRRAAVAGSIGDVPKMLPLTVHIDGLAGPETYHYDILRHRGLAPTLVGLGVVGSLTARGGVVPEATWRWRARLVAPGAPPLVLEDAATGNLISAGTQLAAPLQLLLNNPFAAYVADSVTVDLTVEPGLARAQVVSANIEPRVVAPGQTAHVTAELRDYRGGSSFVEFDVPVPQAQPEGRLVVALAGGSELDKQEAPRLPGRFRAQSLPELLRQLAEGRRDDHLYAVLYGPGVEASFAGESHPELPGFAQRLLASDRANRPTAPFGNLARLAQEDHLVGIPVDGLLTLALDIRLQPLPNASVRADLRRAPTVRVSIPDSEEDQ
jgi:hypothetical protein